MVNACKGHNIGINIAGITQRRTYRKRLELKYVSEATRGIVVNAGILVNIAKPIKIPDSTMEAIFGCFLSAISITNNIDVKMKGS
jgi:hypothetical protein